MKSYVVPEGYTVQVGVERISLLDAGRRDYYDRRVQRICPTCHLAVIGTCEDCEG